MSSLRVIGVTITRDPEKWLNNAQDWFRKKIQLLMESLNLSYKSLPEESSKNLLLINELQTVAKRFLQIKYPRDTTIESIGKDFDIFSRKAEKLQVFFRQKALEIEEAALLEENYYKSIRELTITCVKKGYISTKDEDFIRVKNSLREIRKKNSSSQKIVECKLLFTDLSLLYFKSGEREDKLKQIIEDLKKTLISLNKKTLSDKQRILVKRFYTVLYKIDSVKILREKEKIVSNIEKSTKKLTYIISGKDYINLSELEIKNVKSDDNPDEINIPEPVNKKLVIDEYIFFRDRILSLRGDEADEGEYDIIKGDEPIDRLILLRDNLQLEYGLLKEQIPVWNYVKEETNSIIQDLSSDPEAGLLLDDAIELNDNQYPDPKELAPLRRRYTLYTLKKILSNNTEPEWIVVIKKLLEGFSNKGYITPDMSKSEISRKFFQKKPLLLKTPKDGYGLIMSQNLLNEIVFRLVRYSGNKDNSEGLLTSDMDFDEIKEISYLWDKDFDEISDALFDEGIIFSDKVSRGPESVQIIVMNDTFQITD